MKRFGDGQDRAELILLPECLDDYVEEDNPVRGSVCQPGPPLRSGSESGCNRQLGEHNRKPKPFVWTAGPDRIIEKVNRRYQVIASGHWEDGEQADHPAPCVREPREEGLDRHRGRNHLISKSGKKGKQARGELRWARKAWS